MDHLFIDLPASASDIHSADVLLILIPTTYVGFQLLLLLILPLLLFNFLDVLLSSDTVGAVDTSDGCMASSS